MQVCMYVYVCVYVRIMHVEVRGQSPYNPRVLETGSLTVWEFSEEGMLSG